MGKRLSILAAFGLLLLAGCLETGPQRGPEDGTVRRGPKGNGEAYGIAYQVDPEYSCVKDTGERVPSYTSAIKTYADGRSYLLGDLCSNDEPILLSGDVVERSSYYPELSGYNSKIYQEFASPPSPLDEQRYFVEMWCRTNDSNANEGLDVSVHYSLYDRLPNVKFRKGPSRTYDIPANAFLWDRTAVRTETVSDVTYDMSVAGTTSLRLFVNWSDVLPGGNKFRGTLTNVTTGTAYAVSCRGVSVLKTFQERMAKIGELMNVPRVPDAGGVFYEFNEPRTCSPGGALGYTAAIQRGDTAPFGYTLLPSSCGAGSGTALSAPLLEMASYNPRYIAYRSQIFEYRPYAIGTSFSIGAATLVHCRTRTATATSGLDFSVLFSPANNLRKILRFASDGVVKAAVPDQWYVGNLTGDTTVTIADGVMTLRHQMETWRDIKLDITLIPNSPTDPRYPAELYTFTQGSGDTKEMYCRVHPDLLE